MTSGSIQAASLSQHEASGLVGCPNLGSGGLHAPGIVMPHTEASDALRNFWDIEAGEDPGSLAWVHCRPVLEISGMPTGVLLQLSTRTSKMYGPLNDPQQR